MRNKPVSQWDFEPGVGMGPSKRYNNESRTESGGYRTTEEIVEEMRLAGERLDAYRRGEYESDTDIESDLPLTRRTGFDVADASMALNAEAERIAAIRPALKAEPTPAMEAPVVTPAVNSGT